MPDEAKKKTQETNRAHCEFWLRNGIGKTCLFNKIYFGLLWKLKAMKENFWNSYIALWSYQLNDTNQLTIQAGFYAQCNIFFAPGFISLH